MLNERLEYEQYTFDTLSDPDKLRSLNYMTLKNSLSGLERAMEVVARHVWFEEYASMPLPQRIKAATRALKLWLGFADPADQEDPTRDTSGVPAGWFPAYVKNCLLQDAATDKQREKIQREILDKLKEKEEPFARQGSLLFSSGGNTEKLITYERVLKNANSLGPLKTYLLAAAKSPFEELSKETGGKKGSGRRKSLRQDSKPDRAAADMILKAVALYLMTLMANGYPVLDAKAQTAPAITTPAAVLNTAQLSNWHVNTGRIEAEDLRRFYYQDERIFDQLLLGANTKLLRLQPAFAEAYAFTLIEEDEAGKNVAAFRAAHPDFLLYADQGAGRELLLLP